jgi:hypothetical protein
MNIVLICLPINGAWTDEKFGLGWILFFEKSSVAEILHLEKSGVENVTQGLKNEMQQQC